MGKALADKKRNLFIVLAGIFITNALIAEFIGVKIFSLEKTLGIDPAQFDILGYTLDFNLTAGVMIWPVVFLTTDIINEYFGKKGVQKISFLTVGLISYAFLVIWLVTGLTPAQFWLDLYSVDDKGRALDINYAFNAVYLQGARIIIASLLAFLIGQLLDVFVFHKLRKFTGSRMIWLRATGSTLFSQLIDSFVVLSVAFYFLAPENLRWDFNQVLSVGTVNYMYKFVVAVLLTPVIYLGHFLIDRYLGKEQAEAMAEDATKNSQNLL